MADPELLPTLGALSFAVPARRAGGGEGEAQGLGQTNPSSPARRDFVQKLACVFGENGSCVLHALTLSHNPIEDKGEPQPGILPPPQCRPPT